MTIAVNHDTIHRICPTCMEAQGLDVPPDPPHMTEPGISVPRSERCCFCGLYTPFDLMVSAPGDTVPHNLRTDEWMIAAGMKRAEPEETPDDPRIVTDQ